MSLTIVVNKISSMKPTTTTDPCYKTNYILINRYKKKKFELICNCKERNIIYTLFLIKNKVNYTSSRLYHNNHIRSMLYTVVFYNISNTSNIIYKKIYVKNNTNIVFSYISYIPIDKYLYNIYSLYKYLLLLHYDNKSYEYCKNLGFKKINCMKNYKSILYCSLGAL